MDKNNTKIKNNDLYKYHYFSEQNLIENIEELFPSTILKTQKNISDDFIVKYILSEKYAKIREDREITINELSNYFPNFSK